MDKVENSVTVPGADNFFKVKDISVRVISNPTTNEAERVLTVSSSALVKADELEKHLEVYLLPKPSKKKSSDVSEASDEPQDDVNAEDDASYNADGESGDDAVEGEEGEGEGDQDSSSSESSEESETVEENRSISSDICPVTVAGQVTEKNVLSGQKISLARVSDERPFVDTASFKFTAPADRCVVARLTAGTTSAAGVHLSKTATTLHGLSAFPAYANFVHKGSLLSLAGDKKISLYGRNLTSLKVVLFRVLPNSIQHLVSQTYGRFGAPDFNYNFGPENISEVFSQVITFPDTEAGKPSYSVFDFSQYIENARIPKGLFLIKLTQDYENGGTGAYFPAVQRMILFTDLGFLVKTNQDTTRDVFALSLQNKQPAGQATVSVIGKNGEPIFKGITDDSGKVSLPKLNTFTLEKEPLAYVVEKNGDISFMPYARRDREVNVSRFDVGGIQTDPEAKLLSGYLFSDRGIYRPGETAHLQAIVKRSDFLPLASGVKLSAEIQDPRGRVVKTQKISVGKEGLASFDFSLTDTSLTGTYNWTLNLIGKQYPVKIGDGSFKVQEFEPDRIKVSSTLVRNGQNTPIDPEKMGWISPDQVSSIVRVSNLFGTVAEGNTVKATLQLKPTVPSVTGFPGYTFVNPFEETQTFEEDLGQQTTDSKGEVRFDLGLERFKNAIYRLVFLAQGQEQGSGRSVNAPVKVLINPLPYLIGYKADGPLTYVKKGTKREISIVAVDNIFQKTSASDISERIYRIENVPVLAKTADGVFAYQTQEKKVEVKSQPTQIPAAGTTMPLGSFDVGTYRYQLYTKDSVKVLEFDFTVVGEQSILGRSNRTSEVAITLPKKDFKNGEPIDISIRAPYAGSGFITIEKDRVYAHQHFSCDSANCIKSIVMPNDLEGNGYLTVSFVRAMDSEDIFTNPFSVATEAISVNRERRTLPLTISAPSISKPGAPLLVQVSSARPAKGVIYAVDEGILQVAGYKKPDPLSLFYAKRALEVSTSQILDLLLPEYEIERRLSAAGGDDDAILGKVKNPFKRKGQKPVVFFSGIIDLTPEAKTVSVPIPDYFNGSVKTYVVAVDDSSVGVKDAQSTIQGDLIIQPTLPLTAVPGDQFVATALITNLRAPSDEVTVSVQPSAALRVVGQPTLKQKITAGTDGVFSIPFTVGDVLGDAPVTFVAEAGNERETYSLSLGIRPTTLLRTSVISKKIPAGKTAIEVGDPLFSEQASRIVRASKSPSIVLGGLNTFLEAYPYGCSEQLVSQGSAHLSQFVKTGQTNSRHSKFLQSTFASLLTRQQSDGGISYWDGGESDFGVSIHAAALLMFAEKYNVEAPDNLKTNLIGYLENSVNSNPDTLASALKSAQALYYLSSFGNVVTPQARALLENIRAQKSIVTWQDSRFALYLAGTFANLQLLDDAKSLLAKVTFPKQQAASEKDIYFEDYLSNLAEYLAIVSTHFTDRYKKELGRIEDAIDTEIYANRYSTYSAARTLMATITMPEIGADRSSLNSIVGGKGASIVFDDTYHGYRLDADEKSITVDSKEPQYISVMSTGFSKQIPANSEHGIDIVREYLDPKEQPLTKVAVGDEVIVRIKARALNTTVTQGVIADLIPAGFEIIAGSVKKDASLWSPDFFQLREDRALFFGTISDKSQVLEYRLRAVSTGEFVVPAITAESMYDPQIYGAFGASRITISPR